MARYTYTGRLTDAQRARFVASRNARLFVQPSQSGYGDTGLISDRRIPITVNPDTGQFTVSLEASASVRPLMLYEFGMEWHESGLNHWSSWFSFRAAVGGGAISDMLQIPANPGTFTYGWGKPEANGVTGGIYVDISGEKPVWYALEGARI